LKRLPGIGQKSAQRVAFHLLKASNEEAVRLVEAIRDVKDRIIFCSICSNLTDTDPCRYCSGPTRDRSVICVVEEPYNLVAIEKTREYRGLDRVLHGASPIRGMGPDELRIRSLIERLRPDENGDSASSSKLFLPPTPITPRARRLPTTLPDSLNLSGCG
jgi:recombination protein RecR